MGTWEIGRWQRVLFGAAAVILLVVVAAGWNDAPDRFQLLPFVWAILFAAVALIPKGPGESAK
jgi:hypothetical protein